MLDHSQMHQVFQSPEPKFYDQDLVREIETFRKTFNGVLFIDRVLAALGIAKGKIYPPKGADGLRSLHKQVCDSQLSPHHKLSILYYLLLDHDGVSDPRSQLAEPFAASSGLPRKYQILMKGLWHMDRQQFKFALEHLAHPSLTPEFADEIITVLVRHSDTEDYSLPLAYYHTVQPVLRSSEALHLLFGALARSSVTEALYFSRDYPEHTRQQLFEQLVSSVLEAQSAPGVAERRAELVSLALGDVEEQWFRRYLTVGDGRKLKDAKPALLSRHSLHSGLAT